ncbi:MAG: RnfABCDGE type electron transport complex subunit D, partial [Cyclobacteriaceae bacterium]
MDALRNLLNKQKPLFEKGGKFEKFHYLFEAGETFMFVPNTTTPLKGTQVRDAIDLKRLMMTVVVALIPALIFGIYNTGHMHYLATGQAGTELDKWLLGLQVVLPVVIVAYAAGGLVEATFAVIRRHPINEGFLVTGMLIPLILPPTVPLWQVALGTIFAVVIAKEVFGGTGMNVLNVAMTAR